VETPGTSSPIETPQTSSSGAGTLPWYTPASLAITAVICVLVFFYVRHRRSVR